MEISFGETERRYYALKILKKKKKTVRVREKSIIYLITSYVRQQVNMISRCKHEEQLYLMLSEESIDLHFILKTSCFLLPSLLYMDPKSELKNHIVKSFACVFPPFN